MYDEARRRFGVVPGTAGEPPTVYTVLRASLPSHSNLRVHLNLGFLAFCSYFCLFAFLACARCIALLFLVVVEWCSTRLHMGGAGKLRGRRGFTD